MYTEEQLKEMNKIVEGGLQVKLKIGDYVTVSVNGTHCVIKVMALYDKVVTLSVQGQSIKLRYVHFTTVEGRLVVISLIKSNPYSCVLVFNANKAVEIQRSREEA